VEDPDVISRINSLADEEHQLLARRASGGASPDEHARLGKIEVQLDQCWDLLRQRRARREFGQNPDDAQARDPNTVEHYLQ
jgi:Protein of unknown function (DUF2630)